MPEGIYGEDQWQLMSELAPEVLRFPGGEENKFMHLLHTIDPSDDPVTRSVGYGYDINEIIRYFDYTDGNFDVSGDPLTDVDPGDLDWIDEDLILTYLKYRGYIDEQSYLESDDYYIDQFIRLVEKIETENTTEGHTHNVKVILDLNILSESPAECRRIVEYLRDNPIYDLDVYGVEMGNEYYGSIYGDLLGISDAYRYWDYITGEEVIGFDLDEVLEGELETDHDFLTAFKEDISFNVKVAVPGFDAPGTPANDFFLFKEDGDDGVVPISSDWNAIIRSHYNDLIAITGTSFSRKAFDAVILHPYYSATNNDDTNWGDIPLCLDADAGGDFDYFDDEWDFASYDENLRCAFDGIIGVDDITGNFRELILHRIQDNYFDLNGNLNFDETNDWKKELWTTEWNLLDALDPGSLLEDQLRTSIFTNSFVHDYLLQEWFLRNVKNNHNPAIGNENFFTYATLQNFAGGSTLDLLSPADKQDQLELGVNADCMDASISDYYVARATYFDMFLLKEISANNLDYLPVTGLIFSGNLNITPTIFITESRRQLYVYYSNVKGSTQNYVINPENLGNFFVDEIGVYLTEDPTNIYSVDADQLYSTSGRSTVFEIDNYYDDCENIPYYDNRFEIRETSFEENDPSCSGTIPAGGVCVTVPAHSVGYFVVPITPFWYKMGELSNMFSLYPNPASTFFTIHHQADFADIQEVLKLEVYNSLGNEIFKTETSDGKIVDISNLPVGVYFVKIFNKYNKTEIEQFVKMK